MALLRKLTLFVLGISLLWAPTTVLAHSFVINEPLTMSLGDMEVIQHDDQDDWKGILTLTVTNTGDDPWGDFHFLLTSPTDGSVVFRDDDGYVPNMTGVSSYTYDITDSGLGLDFTFYSDPVHKDESVTFNIYTDNTSKKLSFFQMSIEPSPVPIPGAVLLFASGFTAVIGFLRRKKDSV